MLFRGILEMLLESGDSYARVGIKGGGGSLVQVRVGVYQYASMHQ